MTSRSRCKETLSALAGPAGQHGLPDAVRTEVDVTTVGTDVYTVGPGKVVVDAVRALDCGGTTTYSGRELPPRPPWGYCLRHCRPRAPLLMFSPYVKTAAPASVRRSPAGG
ncbi:hypothetical protein [Streptomyces deserti]